MHDTHSCHSRQYQLGMILLRGLVGKFVVIFCRKIPLISVGWNLLGGYSSSSSILKSYYILLHSICEQVVLPDQFKAQSSTVRTILYLTTDVYSTCRTSNMIGLSLEVNRETKSKTATTQI